MVGKNKEAFALLRKTNLLSDFKAYHCLLHQQSLFAKHVADENVSTCLHDYLYDHSWTHPGANTGSKLISHCFLWHEIKQDIRQWTKECQACARSKIQRYNIAPLVNVTPPLRGRFTNVYVDINGPLGNSRDYNYLLVIIDKFTRFMIAVPLPTISDEECVDAFIRHSVVVWYPRIHIYRPRHPIHFIFLAQHVQFLGAQQHHTSAYYPQAQGKIERLYRAF